MKIKLWSYNYEPEPCGIAPLSTVLAESLRDRGHQVSVVAAHPHYPEPIWGHRLRPHREVRNGIPVLRLPLWIGRDTSAERVRQEVSFVAAKGDRSERTASWARRPYHRLECPEVTKPTAVPANWVPYDPATVPWPEKRRPCKRCLRSN